MQHTTFNFQTSLKGKKIYNDDWTSIGRQNETSWPPRKPDELVLMSVRMVSWILALPAQLALPVVSISASGHDKRLAGRDQNMYSTLKRSRELDRLIRN